MQGGLAARRGNGTDAAFQCTHALFENGIGGIGDPRVDVAAALHVEQRRSVIRVFENIGRREVDRLCARPVLRIGLLPGVKAQGFELVGFRCGHAFSLELVRRRPSTQRRKVKIFDAKAQRRKEEQPR
jgi:hypothetical protein